MFDLSPVQIAALVGAGLLIGWPVLSGAAGQVSKFVGGLVPSISSKHSVVEELVELRSHLLSEPEALKVIDEVLLPLAEGCKRYVKSLSDSGLPRSGAS